MPRCVEWIAHGVAIEKTPDSDSFISPLVPVAKPDGRIRWAVDFRSVNVGTKLLHASLPRVDSNISMLGGSKIFSALDCSWAYHAVPC